MNKVKNGPITKGNRRKDPGLDAGVQRAGLSEGGPC